MGNREIGNTCLNICYKVETTSFNRSYLLPPAADRPACPSCSYMKEENLPIVILCTKHTDLCESCFASSIPIKNKCVLCDYNQSNFDKIHSEKTQSCNNIFTGARLKTEHAVSTIQSTIQLNQDFISQINTFHHSNGSYRKTGGDKKWTGIHSAAFPGHANQMNLSLAIDASNFVVGVGSENYETYEHSNFAGFNNYQDGYSFQNKQYRLLGKAIPKGNVFRVNVNCDKGVLLLTHESTQIASVPIHARIFRLPEVFLWVWVQSQNDSIIII